MTVPPAVAIDIIIDVHVDPQVEVIATTNDDEGTVPLPDIVVEIVTGIEDERRKIMMEKVPPL